MATASRINLPTPEFCPHTGCGAEVPPAEIMCKVCGRHVSYPNARLADSAPERAALDARVAAAHAAAAADGSLGKLHAFEAAMADSKAVIARPHEDLDWLTANDRRFITTYYQMADSGARTPEPNEWDPARDRNDSTINPQYYRELQFAALSLDGVGVGWYGACHVTLRDSAIETRTSLFEVSGVAFNSKNPMIAKGLPNPGSRATWPRRADLAVAKLGGKIAPATEPAEFPAILVQRPDGTGDTDFIEVHVHGSLHPKAFERILADDPVDDADLAVWKRTKTRLAKFGVAVEPLTHA